MIILSKNDSGMTWNAIFSSFPVRTGMASEWLKNDLKCQFSSFPGMIGMTLEWLRNDWKCHFSSFLGMTGMTSEWWFDSFNAHSSHSCHSWFFCYIPSFQPHSAIPNSFRNDEQWGKWGMTSNEWPNLTTFPKLASTPSLFLVTWLQRPLGFPICTVKLHYNAVERL